MSSDVPVRVLWLIKGLGRGGAEQLLVEHAVESRDTTIHLGVAYALTWKDALVGDLAAEGVEIHPLGVRRLADPRWILRLRRLLRRGDYDVVHAHSPQVAAVARLLLRTMRKSRRPAFVSTEHNRWPSHRRLTRHLNRMTFRWNDEVVAVSDEVRDSIDARDRDRVRVLTHGIDLERVRAFLPERDAVRQELGIAPEELLALTIANIRATKNYPGLLETARLVADRDLPIRFAAAGQGPLEREIRTLHAQLGLGMRMQLLGFRSDAARLLAGADLLLFASQHEGLPLAMMEAFAIGVPVIAPAVGGLRTAIVDQVNGLLVAPGDTAALADAVAQLVDPELRTRLAEGARRSAAQYAAGTSVAALNELYASAAQHLRAR